MLKLRKLWSRNVTFATRLVDTVATPMLLEQVRSGRLQPRQLTSHELRLDELMNGYHTVEHTSKERCLRVLLGGA